MIFLRIYRHFQSLLFLKTKEMEKEILHLGPWTSFFFSPWVPGRFGNRGARAAPFPAHRVAGGGGFVGEKKEGNTSYLWRGLELSDVGCGGLAAERGGRR